MRRPQPKPKIIPPSEKMPVTRTGNPSWDQFSPVNKKKEDNQIAADITPKVETRHNAASINSERFKYIVTHVYFTPENYAKLSEHALAFRHISQSEKYKTMLQAAITEKLQTASKDDLKNQIKSGHQSNAKFAVPEELWIQCTTRLNPTGLFKETLLAHKLFTPIVNEIIETLLN